MHSVRPMYNTGSVHCTVLESGGEGTLVIPILVIPFDHVYGEERVGSGRPLRGNSRCLSDGWVFPCFRELVF